MKLDFSIIIFLIFGMTGTVSTALTQGRLILSDQMVAAYNEISALRIQEGKRILQKSDYAANNNWMGLYIENYIDFFTLFIQEDKALYNKLLPNRNYRLKKIRNADSNSPYYRFCQAEIILQWAIIKLKFNDKVSAARDIYEAYNLLEENQQKYPDFILNNKSLSIIHALAENIPSWVRRLLKINGSIQKGTKEIKALADYTLENQHMFKNEVVAIYSYIQFYSNNKKQDAYDLLDKYRLDHRTNPLIAFLKATMAQKNGYNETAIKILEERPQSNNYMQMHYLDFLLGKFKLYRLDKDADEFILQFVNHFKGQHYRKEAYQKLAWHSLVVRNDRNAYLKYMEKCKNLGTTLIDEDKQAFREARNHEIPDIHLLKSRLLYDGGYYQRAYDVIANHAQEYVNSSNEGEYYYRMARIQDALNKDNEAVKYYKITIEKSNPNKYYACSAALNTGLIYERKYKYKDAEFYFNKCLQLNAEGYGNSLHQKAKSGIERINNNKN